MWSIAGFAATTWLEFGLNRESAQLEPNQLVNTGLIGAAVAFAILMTAIALLLRKSSRSHYVLWEAAGLLLLALPVAGLQVAADINRLRDGGETMLITRVVERTASVRGRSGMTRYMLAFRTPSGADHMAESIALPPSVNVGYATFAQASPGDVVELHVAPGWLGAPWYRDVRVRPPDIR